MVYFGILSSTFPNISSEEIPRRVRLVAGEHAIDRQEYTERILKIKRVIVHPSYSFPVYDIALLELTESLVFSREIQPLCLNRQDPEPGSKCVVGGWGRTQGKDIELYRIIYRML